jgi:hypothetical protein
MLPGTLATTETTATFAAVIGVSLVGSDLVSVRERPGHRGR